MAAALAIHRLSASTPARAQPVAARLALQALGADLEDALPRGLPPQSLLWLRRLQLQAPEAALLRPAPPAWRQDWIAAGRQRLDAALAQAARPALGPVPDAAPAVLFADAAEMLACLALAAQAGQLDRWWWRGLLGRAWPRWQTAWDQRPEAQAAAQRLLARVTPAATPRAPAAERPLQSPQQALAAPPLDAPLAVMLAAPTRPDVPRAGAEPAPEGAAGVVAVQAHAPGEPQPVACPGPLAEPAPELPAAAARPPPAAIPRPARRTATLPRQVDGLPTVPPPAALKPMLQGRAPATLRETVAEPASAPKPPADIAPPGAPSTAPLQYAVEHVQTQFLQPSHAPQRSAPAAPVAPVATPQVAAAQAPTQNGRAAALAHPAGTTTEPAARQRAAVQQPTVVPQAEPQAPAWPWPQALLTRQAPLLFVVNALLEDGLYPDFTRPRDPGLPVPLWALLAGLAQAWRLPADPLQAVLQARAADWTPPALMPAAPGAAAAPWPAWLGAYARALRRRLCRRVGRRAAHWPATLALAHPARLWISEAEWVVEFELGAHDVAWRLAGLDRDPGWLPSAGCSLRFTFA